MYFLKKLKKQLPLLALAPALLQHAGINFLTILTWCRSSIIQTERACERKYGSKFRRGLGPLLVFNKLLVCSRYWMASRDFCVPTYNCTAQETFLQSFITYLNGFFV